jgi:hypothetical protein
MGYNDMKTAGYGIYMFENDRKRNGQIEGMFMEVGFLLFSSHLLIMNIYYIVNNSQTCLKGHMYVINNCS